MGSSGQPSELQSSWWDAWWRVDYSWDEGLAEKNWQGWAILRGTGELVDASDAPADALPATLQDYWRDQADDLIAAPDGKRFTRAHLPLRWRDGSSTGKSDWPAEALDEIISAKLAASGKSTFAGEHPKRELVGPDRRAQFQGCVLLSTPAHGNSEAEVSASFEQVAFLRFAVFDSVTFPEGASFANAIFLGHAEFEHARFERAVFQGAIFLEPVLFQDAVFSGESNFFMVDALGHMFWEGAIFSGHASFDRAKFREPVIFERASFLAGVSFDSTDFERSGDFGAVTFKGGVSLRRATFHEGAKFESASFGGTANGERAVFKGSATFNIAAFESVNFSSADFQHDACFHLARFSGDARFNAATFQGDADFSGTRFLQHADFEGAAIKFRSNFDSAQFRGAVNLAFESFAGDAGFDGTQFSHLHRIGFRAGFVFALGAIAAAGALYGAEHLSGWARSVFYALSLALGAATLFWTGRGGAFLGGAALARAQTSFRRLKRLCADVHNGEGQALARALELKASRLRPGHDWREQLFIKPVERAVSLAYEIFAGYGLSLIRPVLWLVVATVGFAWLYWTWEGGGMQGNGEFWRRHAVARLDWSIDNNFIDAEAFSASRMFPLGPWGEIVNDDERCSFRERLLHLGQGPNGRGCQPNGVKLASESAVAAHRLAVQIVATGQSILSAALIFLFALALRRKFQTG